MIIADAGPLIGLARVGLLPLLQALYGTVAVPPQVFQELDVTAARPGSSALRKAAEAGWLVTIGLHDEVERLSLHGQLDAGESAAILLAEQQGSVPLLIDEKRGRAVARSRKVPVMETGGVLLTAKRQGRIESVRLALGMLADAGYRLAPSLRARLVQLAGEELDAGP